MSVAAPLLDGESRLVAPTVVTARAASKVSDVYMYRFSRVAPSSRSAWGGAAHTTEVPYVFDNTTGDASQFEEIDRTVSADNGSGVGAVREDRESKRWRATSMACVPFS